MSTDQERIQQLEAALASMALDMAGMAKANKELGDRIAELEAAMHEAGLTFEDVDEDGRAFPAGALKHGWAGGAST